jgi:hypothetical protein
LLLRRFFELIFLLGCLMNRWLKRFRSNCLLTDLFGGAALVVVPSIFATMLVLGQSRTASATVIASESFNYTTGTALAGANGGTGWGSAWTLGAGAAGAWPNAVNTTNGAPGINATDLAYTAFGGTGSVAGSAQFAPSAVSTSGGSASRLFASTISPTTAGTFWGSTEFKANTSIKFQNFFQLRFSDTPDPTNGLVDAFGAANGTLHALPLLGIGISPINASSSASGSPVYTADADFSTGTGLVTTGDTAQHMFVFQIDTGVTDPANSNPAIRVSTWYELSNGAGTASTFLSTPLNSTPSSVLYYDLSAAEQAGSITGVRLQVSNQASTTSGRNFLMDEIKFGTTAEDVGAISPVAVPEPASVVLFGFGVMGFSLAGWRNNSSTNKSKPAPVLSV